MPYTLQTKTTGSDVDTFREYKYFKLSIAGLIPKENFLELQRRLISVGIETLLCYKVYAGIPTLSGNFVDGMELIVRSQDTRVPSYLQEHYPDVTVYFITPRETITSE